MLARALIGFLFLWSGGLLAADTIDVSVEREGDFYIVSMQAGMALPAANAMRIMQDYDRLTRLSPAIQESRILRHGVSSVRLLTRTRLCILLFCVTLNQVQDMQQTGPLSLAAVIEPQQSDFDSGTATWRFDADGDATLMHFGARLDPKFWVPPVIGPWLLEHMLISEAEQTVQGFERVYAGESL